MTLDEQFFALSGPDRERVERVMRRLDGRRFEPFPVGEMLDRRRAIEESWASGAVEGMHATARDRVLTLKLLTRRVPADLAVELLLEDVVEHASTTRSAVAGEAA